MYTFFELSQSQGKAAPFISAAISSSIIDAGGFANEKTLEMIEAVIELKDQLEEDGAKSIIPSYQIVTDKMAERGQVSKPSKSTIKRAIDIVFLRTSGDKSKHPNTVNLDEFILKTALSDDVAALIMGDRSNLEVIDRRVIEYLVPIVEAAVDGYEFNKVPRVMALAIKFRLTEPDSSIIALQRSVFGNSNGKSLSFGQAQKATKFFDLYANGTALGEIKLNRLMRHIRAYVRSQRRFQRMMAMDQDTIQKMTYAFITGVYRNALEQAKYIDLDGA